jgi:hypothetical protein
VTADEDALAELRHHYGEAYEICSGPWRAKRRDGKRGWIIRDSVDELWEAVREDYRRDPVRRPPVLAGG